METTKKRPYELRQQLEPIMVNAAAPELAEEAIQLYADLLYWEDWLYPPRWYQPKVERMLEAAHVATLASESETQ